jgi:NADH-quinone oxidoreductase subunit D
MTTDREHIRSLDDPDVIVQTPATIYDAIPPLTPRTEREAEFYQLEDGEMFLNLGPQHPSTHGVLRVVLKIDGERIVDIDPVLGYLHRGVEKICEHGDWHHAISNTDPLEYAASMFSESLPVLAAERLLDLEVPRRADYIRVLAWELNRISSHALFIGWLALDLGGLTPILYGFAERDEIVEMLAALTGQKLLFNYMRIGGVNGDLNHEFLSRLGDWMSRAGEHINGQATLMNENEIFVNRTKGLGALDRETALKLGMSGPPLRATGVPYDVRRAHPYSVYPELEFDIPVRSDGDSYARYLLHIEDQVLHKMPDGPVMAKLPRLLRIPPSRAFAALESPRGQYAAYAVSDGSDQPFRFRIHDPSFFNLQAVGPLSEGMVLADIMAIMASLDPIMGGIDK